VGHVESIARAISVSNAQPTMRVLPPSLYLHSGTALAQRIPVRIQSMKVPAASFLRAGMTATVQIVIGAK